MPETEQTKSAYQRVCEQECELCAKGVTRTENGGYYHRYGENGGYAGDCTAPSKEAFMKRQAAQIAAMQAALAKASHHRDCNTNGLICKNCDKWFREHGIATDACPDRNSVFEEVRGCCNCYLSTLSDDVEHGKELLGAKEARDEFMDRAANLTALLSEAVEAKDKAERERDAQRDAHNSFHESFTLLSNTNQELVSELDLARATSQRQAVEIEELRDRSQGYQADCRIYERDLLAIQSAYTKLCATFGMNGDGSRSPEIVALCDAIENSSQQSDGPKVARRKTDSPLVSLYDDPEFMEQWTKEMQTHTLTDAAIKEKS